MKVLCIGDSLTVGMTTGASHPYSKLLANNLPTNTTIYNEGIGGDELVHLHKRLANFLVEQSCKPRGSIDMGE